MPVPFPDGIVVAPHRRDRGMGPNMLNAAKGWATARGHQIKGADANLEHGNPHKEPQPWGLEETERVVGFASVSGIHPFHSRNTSS